MKKVLPLILFFLILLSVAVAENVTQLEYTLIIHGVTLSGYYTGEIVNEKPEFPEDLTDVGVEEKGEEKNIKEGRVVACASVDGRYWFAIIEIPEQERILTHLQSSVDYIAMMADIDL